MTEIRGEEYEGWTHTLSLEIQDRHVVVDTYWRRSAAPIDLVTPVALGPIDALRAAAALIRGACEVMPAVVDRAEAEQISIAVALVKDAIDNTWRSTDENESEES